MRFSQLMSVIVVVTVSQHREQAYTECYVGVQEYQRRKREETEEKKH